MKHTHVVIEFFNENFITHVIRFAANRGCIFNKKYIPKFLFKLLISAHFFYVFSIRWYTYHLAVATVSLNAVINKHNLFQPSNKII